MSNMTGTTLMFLILLAAIAFLYGSVGHGGASGYLAAMAMFGFMPAVMKPTALLLNLFVSLISFVQFYRGQHFIFKLFLPLALASIPCSFIGGTIMVDALLYKRILGILLLFPIWRFLFFKPSDQISCRGAHPLALMGIGGVVGLLSGMIGIGGGIILSPILLVFKWTDMKQTAAISALFIFVNSLAGLAGQFSKGLHFDTNMYFYVGFAIAGGTVGAYLGAKRWNQPVLKNILAGALLIASYKLIFSTS